MKFFLIMNHFLRVTTDEAGFMTKKKFSCDKEVDRWVRLLLQQGCVFRKNRKHGLLYIPNGEVLCIPKTPGTDKISTKLKSYFFCLKFGNSIDQHQSE